MNFTHSSLDVDDYGVGWGCGDVPVQAQGTCANGAHPSQR